ncbi:MAG: ABC transporter substrate-binding protein [Candidatus Limnocylindria bacterium]
MDYSRLDPIRRRASAQELDLVESFARGRITRRSFIKRATILGLSLPTISAIIAACTEPAGTVAPSATAGGGGATPGPAGGTIRVATQRPAGPLDPVGMQDLGAYGLIAQSFEFLAALDAATGDIGPGLAESWAPNDDNSVWTFKIRQGVTWQDGSPFTGEDVVESMKRLVAAGNAGLKGVIDENSTTVVNESTVQFELVSANGNFPYLVSVFNAQTVITPAAYATGTTLDGMPNGTGAWKLDSYDPATGAKFSRNDAWWGGPTPLDSVEYVFFDETGPMVTAYQGGQIDAIVQFDVFSGTALFNDPNFTVNEAQTTNHRQIWMRVDTGQFTDKRVRQAVALSLDREAMVQQLFKGKGQVANDHVIFSLFPYFDDSVPQRTRDVDAAKALLADAGAEGLSAVLHVAELQEIPDLAVLIQSQAAEAGMTLTPQVESLDTFYSAQWCPAEPADPPCSGAAELGIVDYGHRSTPDVFLNSALKTNGVWNSSQYASADFDAAFAEFQAAVGVDAQRAACKKIQTILNDDVPIAVPYTYSFLSGNSNAFTGVYSSALGQMFVSSASKVG